MSPRTSYWLFCDPDDGGVLRTSKSEVAFDVHVLLLWLFWVVTGDFKSFSGTRPGFFFLRAVKMESRSENDGISSKTVTKTSDDATILNWRYSLARCCNNSAPSWMVERVSENKLMNLMWWAQMILKKTKEIVKDPIGFIYFPTTNLRV